MACDTDPDQVQVVESRRAGVRQHRCKFDVGSRVASSESQVSGRARHRRQAVSKRSTVPLGCLRHQRYLLAPEAQQSCGLPEQPTVLLPASEPEFQYHVGRRERESVLPEEPDRVGVIAILHAVKAIRRGAAGDVESGAVRGAAGDVGVGGRLRGVEEWVLLRVAIRDAGLALDPGDVAASVEGDGEVLFRGPEPDGDDVVTGAEGVAGVSRNH